MLSLPDHPVLRNLIDEVDETAHIVDLSPSLAHKEVDQDWWNIPGVNASFRDIEPDSSWRNWASIAAHAKDSVDHECVACLTPRNKQVQGAMLYCTNAYSIIDPSQSAVEVILLATAPRNRDIFGINPEYRGVGTALLFRAVAHSYLLGLRGRIVLVSKKVPETLDFYGNRGFMSHSMRSDGNINMELQPPEALVWLREKGFIV